MDWIISDELGLTVGHLVGWGAAGAMIIGGVAPYIPQFRQIKRTQDAEGFSLYVCLTLLIANTLRILFWFGKRYELPLLIQSVVMNITMFVMIHLCVNVRKKNQIIRARERIFTGAIFMLYILMCCANGSDQPDETARWLEQHSRTVGGEKPHRFYDMEKKYFWAWTDFQSYVDCMLVFSVIGAAVTYLLIEFAPFVELIGFMAVFTEAMLGAPQIAKNHQNKSTEGMSLSMVIMWTCGDIFKTAYFVMREAPTQFWVCGALQVSLDVVILIQMFFFRYGCTGTTRRRRDARGAATSIGPRATYSTRYGPPAPQLPHSPSPSSRFRPSASQTPYDDSYSHTQIV